MAALLSILLDKQAAARYNAASPAEKATMDKLAALHNAVLDTLTTDIEKIAYAMGAQDGAAMMDSEGGDPSQGGSEEGTIPGAEGEAGPEEIMAMLEQLVQSGEITEEQAQQLITELQGEMGGGDQGGDPSQGADPMAAQGMPPEAKQASALLKEFAPDLFKAPVVEEPKK